MTKVRVTCIVCLGCRGSGQLGWLTGPCPRCEGVGKVPVTKALALADERYALANGGFSSGDYGLATRTRLRNEATSIYAIAGTTPPWQAECER